MRLVKYVMVKLFSTLRKAMHHSIFTFDARLGRNRNTFAVNIAGLFFRLPAQAEHSAWEKLNHDSTLLENFDAHLAFLTSRLMPCKLMLQLLEWNEVIIENSLDYAEAMGVLVIC
jgi:hypothetical protein